MRLLRNKLIIVIPLLLILLAGCSDTLNKLSVGDNTPPEAVSNLQILNANDTYIQVTWEKEFWDNYPDHYLIYLCENNEQNQLKNNLYTDKLPGFQYAHKQGITLKELQPDTEYKIAVVTANIYGSNYGIEDSLVMNTVAEHIEDTESPLEPQFLSVEAHLTKGIITGADTEISIVITPSGTDELITPEIRYVFFSLETGSWETATPVSNPDLYIPECLSGEPATITFSFLDAPWPQPFASTEYNFVIFVKSHDTAGNSSDEALSAPGIYKVEVQSGCIKCWNCVDICPENAISKSSSKAVIDLSACTRCGDCVLECAESGSEVIFFKTEETNGGN